MEKTFIGILAIAAALLTLQSGIGKVTRAANGGVPSAEKQLDNPGQSQPDEAEVTEEFHQVYPLTAPGRVSIENVNGDVHISVWDQNEVKVDAVKRASNKERLDEVKIEVNTGAESVKIKTRYSDHNQTFSDSASRRHNNSASVEYSITIPRKARIESADLVNGALEIEGAEGDVNAACVNGNLKARGLTGEVKLSTVNGGVEATMIQLDESKAISLNSVNGSISLSIPPNANAQIRASTIQGAITNDFGLKVDDGQFVGHDLSGQLGTGGPRIRLNNVNGSIKIKRS